MKLRIALSLAALAALAAIVPAQQKGARPDAPNVLFITIDTLRADHLSSYGYHLKTSPRIDALAEQGVLFENAYSVTSRTAPSHFSMFSSRYPQEHGAKLNGIAPPKESKYLFLPQILQKFGYKNAAFVSSWVLTSKLTKMDRFFDVYDEDLSRSYQMINSMRYAEDVVPRAIAWLEQNKDERFFTWVHLFDPHSPYDFREDFNPTEKTGAPDLTEQRGQDEALDNLKAYNSEILYSDHWVGKLLDAVDDLGLADNTLVVLTADHGESIGERGYQGHANSLYDNVVHVPLVFRLPGRLRAGTREPTKVSLLDLTPTILDLTVHKIDPKAKIPSEFVGRSLAANLTSGAELPDRQVRFVGFAGQKWVMPKWFAKLWLGDNLEFPRKIGYRTGDQKVIWAPDDDELQIFNLSSDPFEFNPIKVPKSRGKKERDAMTRWYESTDKADGENRMSERDKEALESLGYIQ